MEARPTNVTDEHLTVADLTDEATVRALLVRERTQFRRALGFLPPRGRLTVTQREEILERLR